MIIPPVPTSNYLQIVAAQALAAKVARFAPVAFQTGGETWFDGAGAFVLTDAGDWERVWDRHVQNESIGKVGAVRNLQPAPGVDFGKAVVVALFAGTNPSVVAYRVVGGYTVARSATLRLAPVIDTNRNARIAVPRPWAFIVLPRTKSTVDVQLPKADGTWGTVVRVPPTL